MATTRCALCGGGPPFGASANVRGGVMMSLHHDQQNQHVGYADDGAPIYASCYEAWTVWNRRPTPYGQSGMALGR